MLAPPYPICPPARPPHRLTSGRRRPPRRVVYAFVCGCRSPLARCGRTGLDVLKTFCIRVCFQFISVFCFPKGRKMMRRILRNRKDRKGQGLVEYALIIAGVAVIGVVGISMFGHKTADLIGTVAAVLPGAHTDDNGAITSGHLIGTTVGRTARFRSTPQRLSALRTPPATTCWALPGTRPW